MKAIGAFAITAVFLLAIAITWSVARSTAQSEVVTVRRQMAACEERAAARHADDLRVVATATETSRHASERVQELETKNMQLQQEIDRKAEVTVAPARLPGSPAEKRTGGKAATTTPQQTFALGAGEQKSLIPGVLSVSVASLLPTSAEVDYGGHPRHLKVGENITVSYLGLPCVLTLAEIKSGNNGAPTGSFAFSVASKGDFAAEPADGPTPYPLPARRR